MVSIKKTALAVITLGISGVASAGMYTPPPAPVPTCTGVNVLVPCERNAWDLGIQALYVQTNSVVGTTTFVATDSITDGIGDVTTDVQNFNPDWTWGFRIEGSYHFWTGSDINLNWTHFDHNDDDNGDDNNGNDTTVVVGDHDVVGRFVGDPDVSGEAWDAVGTEIQNRFDEVNLEYGQTVMFGEHATARFHAGLQWAQIERNITQAGVFLPVVVDDITTEEGELGLATSNSKFSGIGPRAGVDWNYGFNNGFAVVAHTAAALLVGETNLNVAQGLVDDDGDLDEFATANPNDERTIVPAVEAKLGLAYTAPMSQGDLTIEGGYQVAHYWNSVDEGSVDFDGDFTQNEAGFSFQGVYLGLKWMGNA